MKMKKAITKKKLLLILVLNLPLTAVALPPDIEADRLLIEAEQFINNNNFAQAASSLEEILTLQQQHNLEIPVDFYFKYAEIILNSDDQDKGEKAYLAVTHYLETAGRAGEHYQQALELYNQASVLHSQEISRNLIDEIKGEARLEIVRQLIANGADVNAIAAVDKNANGSDSGLSVAPLHLAAGSNNNNAEIIEALIAAGAKVNFEYSSSSDLTYVITPLRWAARYSNNSENIEALIAAGANVNVNAFGDTPLHHAAVFNNNPEIIEALIAAGANVNVADNNRGWTPLYGAVTHNNNPEIIEALIAAGANVNVADNSGWTPLHGAVTDNNNPEIIEALIAAGANVNVADNSGWTPLHGAVTRNNNPEIIEALIAAGANVRAKDDRGDRPLDGLDRNSSMNSSDKETVERWLRRPRLLR